MSTRKTIKRITQVAGWLALGAILLFILVSAMRQRAENTCRGYSIVMMGDVKDHFIDKAEVVQWIKQHGDWNLKGRKLESINLRQMEEMLKKNDWISNAELFVDNNRMVKVSVWQKRPVARVFTMAGNSFYIDTACERLPVPVGKAVRVPVFTGFPLSKENKVDKALLEQIKTISLYLEQDPLSQALVEQIDITAEREFEMVPAVGSFIVELGDASDCKNKFERLGLFYKMVLSKVGFDYYERVKVQYEKQVVAVKREGKSNAMSSAPATADVQQIIKSISPEWPQGSLVKQAAHEEKSEYFLKVASHYPVKDQTPYEHAALRTVTAE
jgi:cell division protein FtsQ